MKKMTIAFSAALHHLIAQAYAGSVSTSLSGSALYIDPSITTLSSGGDSGKLGTAGSGGDTSKLGTGGSSSGSGGSSITTYIAPPSTDSIYVPPPTITLDPSVLTTVLSSGGVSGGSSGSGGSTTTGTGGSTPLSSSPIAVVTAEATPSKTTDTTAPSTSLLDTVISTLSDITTQIIDTIIPPTTTTDTKTTTDTTATTTTDTTPVSKDPVSVLTTTVDPTPTKDTTTALPTTDPVKLDPTPSITETVPSTTADKIITPPPADTTVYTKPTPDTLVDPTLTKDTTTALPTTDPTKLDPTPSTTEVVPSTTTDKIINPTPTDTTSKDTTTTTSDPIKDTAVAAPTTEPKTIIDKVVDVVTTVVKDVVDLVSSSPTPSSSPFTADYCFHLPFMDTCSACLSTKQVQEKVNDLNSDLINQGIDTYKYGFKLDWSLLSGKIITLNPDGTDKEAILPFNICEASSSEVCELPIRNSVSAADYPTYTLDNLLIFSFIHPEQANKTVAICSTLANCSASLTTLSNGQYGLSMKISDVKKTWCIDQYHGKILEYSGSDPALVTCLAEIPVCQQPVEETKIIDTKPADTTPIPQTTDPVKEPVKTPETVTPTTDPLKDTTNPTTQPTTATEPTKEAIPAPTPAAPVPAEKVEPLTQPQSVCDMNPIDPSCFACLTIQQAKESVEWINRIIATSPEPRPDPMTLSFDWVTHTGKITAPANSTKLTSYTFQVCDTPEAMCVSTPSVTPDLNYISQNGLNSILLFSSINHYQADKIAQLCNTSAKPAGSCEASIIDDPAGYQYLRIKALTAKDSCIAAVGGVIVDGPNTDGDVTCIFKKTLCGIVQPIAVQTPEVAPEKSPATPVEVKTPEIAPELPKTDTPTTTPEAPKLETPKETPTPPATPFTDKVTTTPPPTQIIISAPVTPTPEAPKTISPATPQSQLPAPTPSEEKASTPKPEEHHFATISKPAPTSPATPTPETGSPQVQKQEPLHTPISQEMTPKAALVVIFCEEGTHNGFYIDEQGNKKEVNLGSACPDSNITENDHALAEYKEMTSYREAPPQDTDKKTKLRKRIKQKIDSIIENPVEKVEVTKLSNPDQQSTQDTSQKTSVYSEAPLKETTTEPINKMDGHEIKEKMEKEFERLSDDLIVAKTSDASLLPDDKSSEKKSPDTSSTFSDFMIDNHIGALAISSAASASSDIGGISAIVQPYPASREAFGTGCTLIPEKSW